MKEIIAVFNRQTNEYEKDFSLWFKDGKINGFGDRFLIQESDPKQQIPYHLIKEREIYVFGAEGQFVGVRNEIDRVNIRCDGINHSDNLLSYKMTFAGKLIKIDLSYYHNKREDGSQYINFHSFSNYWKTIEVEGEEAKVLRKREDEVFEFVLSQFPNEKSAIENGWNDTKNWSMNFSIIQYPEFLALFKKYAC